MIFSNCQYFRHHWCCSSYLKEILFPTCHYFCHHWWRSSYLKQILDFSSFSRKAPPPQSEMTSVFLSHRSDFTFLSGFPSSYLIFQFLAFDPNSRFKTQISSSKFFNSVKDNVPFKVTMAILWNILWFAKTPRSINYPGNNQELIVDVTMCIKLVPLSHRDRILKSNSGDSPW